MTTLTDMLRYTARATAFLSRLPMPSAAFEGDDGKVGRLSGYFPVAGLVIGLAPALLLYLLLAFKADALMAALLSLGLLTVVTGALHEDGLADTADGVGAGGSRERRLDIMKDSRIGTYGAVALILSLALRASALATIARDATPFYAALVLVALVAISRAGIVWQWSALPAARAGGLAAASGQPDGTALRVCLVCAGVIAAVLIGIPFGLKALIGVLVAAALSTLAFTRFVRQQLSGHTGDTLGAGQQICEAAALCALALAV